MKIAIFHDFIDVIGGSEKLVLTLARELNADVITTDVDDISLKNLEFDDVNVISIGKTIKRPMLRQISTSIRFMMCDFSDKYDFFIFSGNWTHFGAKKHKPNILYCHSPVRAFYDLYDSIFKESFFRRSLFVIWVKLHKHMYEHYLNDVQTIITNSKNTQLRIKKYLHRDSQVIYPPVDFAKHNFQEFGDFWLSVNRLYPEKRIELQIQAFKLIPDEKLVIVGDYTKGDYFSKYAEKIKLDLPKNIEIFSTVAEKELLDLYSRCKGFVSTAKDEDFGMAVVEAMASGKPVVCVNEGGYVESVKNEITGFLVEAKVEKIVKAVKRISNNPEKYQAACEAQAKKFDKTVFISQMREKIPSSLTHNSS